MLTRRDLLRATALSGLVVFAGCGADDEGPSEGDLRLVSSDVGREAADPGAVADGVAAVSALAAGLYGQLVPGDANAAISPFSAAVALGMTANGAAGVTAEQMLAVLGASDVASLDDGLNALTAHVESLAGSKVALDSANQVFGQRGTDWEAPFLDALARSFGAGVREVDFEGATETARTAINAWTAEQTHDLIEEIVPPDTLDSATRMVLVNALYFKAPWLEPFEESATRDQPFHLGSGESVDVPMMNGHASCTEGSGWRAAHLPYAGDRLAMTLVLPDAEVPEGVDAIIAGGGLADLLAPGSASVALTMPKFGFLVGAPLTPALETLGMVSAFDPDAADFSAMTSDEQLYVSAVLQQVFIAVDEAGTEAAAATAVVATAGSAPGDPPEPVVLDRPFVFVIHDVEHGTPLFVGKVADPR